MKVKKRTIRWADMTYSDEEEEMKDKEKDLKDTTNNYIQTQQRKDPIINTQTKIPTGKHSSSSMVFFLHKKIKTYGKVMSVTFLCINLTMSLSLIIFCYHFSCKYLSKIPSIFCEVFNKHTQSGCFSS